MRHLLTTLALALAFIAGAFATDEHAVVYGTLLKYKSDLSKELPNAAREYFVIRFDKPFETEHSNWENEDGGKAGKVRITEIQLDYAGEDSELKALIGKKVIAEGGIMERNLSRQMRPLILDVELGNIKAGAFMIVKERQAETKETTAPPAATPAATPEIASGIDYSRENAEAEEFAGHRRTAKAAAAECIERYGKKVADNLKGVQAIAAEYYDAKVEAEDTTEGISLREAMDDFYVAVLVNLRLEQKAIPAGVYEKESMRIGKKWSRRTIEDLIRSGEKPDTATTHAEITGE